MKNLKDIQLDWFTSRFYKEKQMNKWASEYINENEVDFELLKAELQQLISRDNLIGLNNFNKYGVFDMYLSTIPNALVTALINASK